MSKFVYVTDPPWCLVADGNSATPTDNTVSFQVLKNFMAPTGGEIRFPPGAYAGCFDRTNCDGVELVAEGDAIGSGKGVRLLPFPGYNTVLDLSGSSGPIRGGFQIGGNGAGGDPLTTCQNGVLMAQTADRPSRMTFCDFRDAVFITGRWTGFGLVGIGVTDWTANCLRAYNFIGSNAAIVFLRRNLFGMTSHFATIDPSSNPSGNILMNRCELHDEIPAPSRSNGMALLLFGTDARLVGGSMVSSCTNGGAIQMYTQDGTISRLEFDGVFSSQTLVSANYCFSGDAGSIVYEASKMNTYEFAIAKATAGINFV